MTCPRSHSSFPNRGQVPDQGLRDCSQEPGPGPRVYVSQSLLTNKTPTSLEEGPGVQRTDDDRARGPQSALTFDYSKLEAFKETQHGTGGRQTWNPISHSPVW